MGVGVGVRPVPSVVLRPALWSCVSCSLSTSTLSCSSGSSRGSLTSSRGSLATTSSLGSTSSLSFSDLYLEQPELSDPDLQNKLDSLLQDGPGGYRPHSSITTIHEHEVVAGGGRRDAARTEDKTAGAGGDPEAAGRAAGAPGGEASRIQALRLSETPRSMSSLSPRSSLSSLSPPCSPLVTDASFLSGETEPSGLDLDLDMDLELRSRLAELELSLDPEEQLQEERRGQSGLEEKQNHKNSLGEEGKGNGRGRSWTPSSARRVQKVRGSPSAPQREEKPDT